MFVAAEIRFNVVAWAGLTEPAAQRCREVGSNQRRESRHNPNQTARNKMKAQEHTGSETNQPFQWLLTSFFVLYKQNLHHCLFSIQIQLCPKEFLSL